MMRPPAPELLHQKRLEALSGADTARAPARSLAVLRPVRERVLRRTSPHALPCHAAALLCCPCGRAAPLLL
eukprot:5749387-Prymnesium_polylepis.1